MKSYVAVRTEILADHRWPGAPEERGYLANQHVHVFKITAHAQVSHSDRQIEFHDLRTELHRVVTRIANHRLNGLHTFEDMSCEQIGEKILEQMPQLSIVTVSEDGQFDAVVMREEEPSSESNERIKRAYLASASKGDRDLLRQAAEHLTDAGYMVFAPCLGFCGEETTTLRPHIMDVCLSTLRRWAQILFVLDEGIPSEGCEIERKLAEEIGIPTARFTLHKRSS